MTENGEFANEKREVLTKHFDSARQLEVISDLSRQGDQKLKSRTSHDQLGRVVKVENSEDGVSFTIFAETVYREMGRITFTSNPRRAGAASTDGWTRITNDALGRVIEVATFSGAGLPPNSGTNANFTGSVTTVYDSNETTVTDQASRARKSVTDALGRLTKVIEDPGGSAFETTYSYDALGNLRFVNQGTQQREFTYDGLSRLLSAKNPEQVNSSGVKAPTSYEYDDASNLKKRTNPNGATVDFTYDGLNRVKTKTLSVGPVYTFGYDSAVNGKGRLASAMVAGGDGFYYDSYDKAGKVLQTRQLTTGQGSQFSYTMSYGYDLAGNMTKEVYPSGRTIKTGYDTAGRMNKVSGSLSGQNKDYLKSASYTAHGALSAMVIGNDLTEATGFNSRLQPTTIGVTFGPTVTLFDLSYKYGVLVGTTLDEKKNNGNVQSQEIKVGTTTIKQSYSYDALNRLSSAGEALNGASRWTQSYEYDRFGNRTLLTNTGTDGGLLPTQTTPGVNGATNRLIGFSYDPSGNVLGDGAGNTFTYDAENHQLTHTRAGVTTSYVYDGEGRRVKKESSGVTTIFVYNAGSQLIAEYTTDPVPPPVGGGGTSYLTTDHLGSTRLVTDQNRNVKSRRDYCPYGEELGAGVAGRTGATGYGQADGLRQKFTGNERDAESGLDYFLARYYSSAQGRFMSPDEFVGGPVELYYFAAAASSNPTFYGTLANPQTLNKYLYCTGNPLRYVDPNGHGIMDYLVELAGGMARGYAASVSWGLAPGSTPNENDSITSLVGQAIGTVLAANHSIQMYTGGAVMEESGVLYAEGVAVEMAATSQAVGASLNASRLIGAFLKNGVDVPEGSPLDEARGSGGSQDVEVKQGPTLRGISEEKVAYQKADKLTGRQKEGYEKLLDNLSRGKAGGNQHNLTGNLAGKKAADLPGSGKGRGKLRVIFSEREDGGITIHDIVDYHK